MGKGEGLNPCSKGGPGTHGCLSAACKAQEAWAIVVSSLPSGTQPC